MRGLGIIVFLIATLSFTACTTMPSSTTTMPSATTTMPSSTTTMPSSTPSGQRVIILNDKAYSETDIGKFVSWRCKDLVQSSGTLVELGTFTNSKLSKAGFILYDGGNSGELTHYGRKGINHRWDWGPHGIEFSFIIKPDGTGLFYDFSSVPSGKLTKANDVFQCDQ